MTTALLERPTIVTNEWNHSCTPQCPNPCPAAQSAVDTDLTPEMATDHR